MARQVGKFSPYTVGDAARLAGSADILELGIRRPSSNATGPGLVRSRIALAVRLMSLAPGDRLPDTGVLAESLSIGEITVRRTLETMCQDGLLERRRGRTGGTFVAANWDSMVAEFHDEGHARPLAELHLLLEAGLVAIGCGDDRSDEVRVLGELVLELDGTVDARAAASLEARFHLELAQQLGTAAAAERAAELLGRLCWLRPGPDLDTLRRLNETHRALLAALGSGSVEAAVAAVTEHASRSGLH